MEFWLNYHTSLKQLLSLIDFERPKNNINKAQYHLHRIEEILKKLGNPHLSTPTIHVAGTKGKGSTSAFISSLLSAQGYRVGLYTSPHLHTFRERIRIGFEPIPENKFADLVQQLWPLIKWTTENSLFGPPTTFEILTCMAFLYFKNSMTDYQVIEVGLGGRLDTTNIVNPEVCVLTPISLDHIEVLGDTLKAIAKEKAGIIKSDAIVVVSPQPIEAMEVFQETSRNKAVELISVDNIMSWTKTSHNHTGQKFVLQDNQGSHEYWIPLLGMHQIENACTAIASVKALKDKGHKINENNFPTGLKDVQWPGRLQVLNYKQRIFLVDSAHNESSIHRLIEAINTYFEFDKLIVLFGTLDRHDTAKMIKELSMASPEIIAVRSRHPMALPSDVIANQVKNEGLKVIYQSDSISKSINYALDRTMEGGLILGTGSLFIAAEILEVIENRQPELYPELETYGSFANKLL